MPGLRQAIGSILGLIVAVAPRVVEARPAVAHAPVRSHLQLAPALADPWSSISEEPAASSGRAIDPEVATGVPLPSVRPIPPPPVFEPRELDIQRRLGGASVPPQPAPEEEPPRGLGLLITGGALVVPGALLTVIGFSVRGSTADSWCMAEDGCQDLANEPSSYSGGAAFGLAVVAFGTSAVLLTIGGLQRREWLAWHARQPPPPPPPPPPPESSAPSQKRGIAMMVTGGSLAGPATAYFISVMGRPWEGPHIRDDPMRVVGMTLGGLFFTTGVTLLAIGARRNVKYKQWRDRQSFAPITGRTVFGTWIAGVALRF